MVECCRVLLIVSAMCTVRKIIEHCVTRNCRPISDINICRPCMIFVISVLMLCTFAVLEIGQYIEVV